VSLGTITVYNISGTVTELLVKRHSTPSNHMYACPLFTLCDSPLNTKLCLEQEAGCTSLQTKPQVSADPDPAVFRTVLNRPMPDPSPPTPSSETISVFGADIWVAGQRITGEQVHLNFDGARFFINEVEMSFEIAPRIIPDEDLLSTYGSASRFQELRATASVRDAVEQLEEEISVLIGTATIAYMQSGTKSARQVFAASNLVTDVTFEGEAFRFSVRGLLGRRGIDFSAVPDPSAKPPSHQQRVTKLFNSIKQTLSRPYPGGALLVISRGGSKLFATGAERDKGLAQINHLLNGGGRDTLPKGPFVPSDVLLRDFIDAEREGR